jgi:outer membrane protein assembly factor BamB
MASNRLWRFVVCTFGICACCVSSARGANLMRLPAVSTVQYGGYINDLFVTKFKDLPLVFPVDLERGEGFFDGTHGIIAVPIKGLNEARLTKDAATATGAGLCHLFVGSGFQVVAADKPIDDKRLRIVQGIGNSGEPTSCACYVGTVRRAKGGTLELCLFGTAKDPVFTAPLGRSSISPAALHLEIGAAANVASGVRQTLDFSLVGGYTVSIPFETRPAGPSTDADAPSTVMHEAATAASKRAKRVVHSSSVSTLQLDNERSGYLASAKDLPKSPRVLWSYGMEGSDAGGVPGDPVVDQGVVYFGDDRGRLHALSSKDGSEKWVGESTPFRIIAAPTIANGLIYSASTGDAACIAAATGKTVWRRALPKSAGECAPLVVGDLVIVTSGDGFIQGLDRKQGKPRWGASLIADRPADTKGFESQGLLNEGFAARTRSAASDGALVFQPVYDQGRLLAFDCRTGARRWTYQTRGWIWSHPVVADNFVLIAGNDLYLHCVNRQTGKPVWKFPAGAEVQAAPAVANGRVYLAAWNARVHCVELATGKPLWMHRMDNATEGSFYLCAPLVTDEAVYIGSINGTITALDATTGDTLWSLSLPINTQISGFAFATDGQRLFARSRNTEFQNGNVRTGLFALGD